MYCTTEHSRPVKEEYEPQWVCSVDVFDKVLTCCTVPCHVGHCVPGHDMTTSLCDDPPLNVCVCVQGNTNDCQSSHQDPNDDCSLGSGGECTPEGTQVEEAVHACASLRCKPVQCMCTVVCTIDIALLHVHREACWV